MRAGYATGPNNRCKRPVIRGVENENTSLRQGPNLAGDTLMSDTRTEDAIQRWPVITHGKPFRLLLSRYTANPLATVVGTI